MSMATNLKTTLADGYAQFSQNDFQTEPIARLRNSSKHGHSAPVPEAVGYTRLRTRSSVRFRTRGDIIL